MPRKIEQNVALIKFANKVKKKCNINPSIVTGKIGKTPEARILQIQKVNDLKNVAMRLDVLPRDRIPEHQDELRLRPQVVHVTHSCHAWLVTAFIARDESPVKAAVVVSRGAVSWVGMD